MLITICLAGLSCNKPAPAPAPATTSVEPVEAPEKSKLYLDFDASAFRTKYFAKFKEARDYHVRTDVILTPPGDRFKDFHVGGKMTEAEVKAALAELKDELWNLAKASGVEVAGEPKDVTLLERPISMLIYLHNGTLDLGSIRGFSFNYSQGSIRGAVDLFVIQCLKENEKQWSLMCAVHEAKR
jgi:hypothetical protein